jgi:hypothetical protein
MTGPAEPAVTPEAGTEHFTGPAIPGIPETLPVLVAAEPAKPWYRKVPGLAWAAIIAVVAGGVTASVLMLTAFSTHPAAHPAAVLPAAAPAAVSVPDTILAHDGYFGTVSVSGSVLQQILGSSGPDGAAIKSYISSASAGFKSKSTEVVLTLTPAGRQLFTALLPTFHPGDAGPGVTVYLAGGNRYLVITGPQKTLGSPGDLKTS